ncbi:hypothetical protein [Enterococcus sp. 5H]|uniref:hypothetical protein n=1 Tax=Enterococcus sp. 5H TaxID=1229490 RepID=UPI002302066A|nr:hypothetical protein [Enterococcus sp. 5H]MDA9472290.1 hypothetical protein [Enterococcus sp. 5H]
MKSAETYPLVYDLRRDQFTSKGKTLSEKKFLECVYDYAHYKRGTYFGTPVPKSLKEYDPSKDHGEKEDITIINERSAYYKTEETTGDKIIFNNVLKEAEIRNLQPQDKNELMALLSDEAKRLFEDIEKNNIGLIEIVTSSLYSVLEQTIPNFIYYKTSEHEFVRSSNIDIKLENKIEKIIQDAIDVIENLSTE